MVKHFFINLTVVIISLVFTGSAFATAILEGEKIAANPAIQIIEGDRIVNGAPPIPRLYGGVSENISLDDPSQNLSMMIRRYNKELSTVQVTEISQAIYMFSDSYNLDPRLVASVVAVESSFRPNAVSPTGAIGLGQLKPSTAKWLGVDDPFHPVQNLAGVVKYLRYLMDRYNGNTQYVLAAYFQGQGTIDRSGINDNARYYISKVHSILGQFFNTAIF